MNRYALDHLENWLISDQRKPLILRGARQVGKTWLVRSLAEKSGKKLCEINFEKRPELALHFSSNEPTEILKSLALDLGLKAALDPEKTLLFLDEIQAAPELLAKLRWFYEMLPVLAVIAAGSLLEFTLAEHSFSMPVGRVSYFFLEPLGFEEFLLAKGEELLVQALQKLDNGPESQFWNEALHQKTNLLFKEYLWTGGMPEAVVTWVKTGQLEAISEVHQNLISTYRDDFSKYAGRLTPQYLNDVLSAVPRFLSQKFIYSRVNPEARHGSIKQAVELLTQARLCHLVQAVHANGIPLEAEKDDKNFKLILIDAGLATASLGLSLKFFSSTDFSDTVWVNQGALAEQVVGQLLRLNFPFYMSPHLYYWTRSTPGSSAEIDYLIQHHDQLIPIEVKSGAEGKMRSLHQFMAEKKGTFALRIYAGPLLISPVKVRTTTGQEVAYQLLSIPFYLIEQIPRLLEHFS